MNVSTYDTVRVSQADYYGYLEFVDIFDPCKFYSRGKNGKFEIRIMITRLKHDREGNLFNLGFGVWDKARQIVDDRIQTKNDDMPQILATVAGIALNFLKKYPSAELYAEGSTFARTRLYQREICKIIDDMPTGLCILGLIKKDDIGFVEFRKGINFDGFLLLAK
jgi:hypothetical protein